MNNDKKPKKISVTAKNALNKQTEGLSSDTQQRLRLAREKALEQAHRSSWLSFKWLSGAGAGIALAGVIAFMIVPNLQTNNPSISPLDDLEMLSAEFDMELVDDLEFYQWLDESLAEHTNES